MSNDTSLPSSIYDDSYLDGDFSQLRDPSISIAEYVLDTAGIELGFFFVLMLGCVYMLLNQVDGKIFRMKIFLMNRDFHLVQHEGFISFINLVLRTVSWISLLMPFMALGVWAAGLIVNSGKKGEAPVGGICVLMVGISFVLFTFSTLKIKWNNYQFTSFNALCYMISVGFLTAYQFIAVFLDYEPSFFGYSAIFLSANAMIMIVLIFLNFGITGGSIRDLLHHRLEKGQPRDPRRDQDFDEEVNEEKADKSYFPKYQDIIDLFTIGKMGEDHMASAFGGGLQHQYNKLKPSMKRLITLILWSFATAILVVYSYVIYWKFENSKLGFVIMIAILVTDVIVYFIYNSKIVTTPTPLALTCFLNRLLLFVFGGDYWIYGYMVLYMFYTVILSNVIANRRFPFESALSNVSIENLHGARNHVDISRVPEFLIAVITAIYAAIFALLYFTSPTGVPLRHLEIDNFEYPFYICAIFTLIIMLTFFSVLAIYRLFIRKKKKIEPKVHFYLRYRKFDMYWMFVLITFLCMLTISLLSYYITQSVNYFIVIILVTVYILFYINANLHYVLNDYEILQNIDDLNAKIKKHNERLGELKEKVVAIKKDLKEGKSDAIGASSLGLAQNILKQEKEKKQAQNELKKIQEANRSKTQDLNQTNKSLLMSKQSMIVNRGQTQSPESMNKISIKVADQKQNAGVANVNVRVLPSPLNLPPINNGQVLQTQVGYDNTSSQWQQQQPNNQPVDDTDKLINELLVDKKKGGDPDDIYEGGDQEQLEDDILNDEKGDTMQYKRDLNNFDNDLDDNGNGSDDDSSDEELDPEVDDEQSNQKRQKKRIREIVDWRDTMNWFQAFWTYSLRPNDYQIIFSLICGHAALVLMAIIVSIKTHSYIGISIAIPLVHYGMAAFSLIKTLSTDAKLSYPQYFFFFFSYIIQYGWGIANLFLSYTHQDVDPTKPGQAGAGLFIVLYLIVIPFITSFLSAALKYYDDKRFSFFMIIQISLTFLQGIGMLVCAYVFMTYVQGIVVSCVVVFVAFIVLQIWIYVKNDFYMPIVWTVIDLILVGLIIISALVISLCFDTFSDFFGFSISVWVFAALLFVYALSEISSDISRIEQQPLFFSPWIFPVYIYNPKKNDVQGHNLPSVSLVLGFIIMIGWSISCSVWVYPHHVGVSLSILFEIFLVIIVLYLVQVSSQQLRSVTADIDKKIIRRAWLDSKQSYINTRQAQTRQELVTYETMLMRKNFFRNMMRDRQGRKELTFEEKSEGIILIENKNDIDLDWVDENLVDISKVNSCYSYLYTIEKECDRIYIEELELIIQFQLLIVQQAENYQEQKKKYLFTFLNEKKAALFALGIVIDIPDQGSLNVRYARVIIQISKLSPEKQTMFNHLRDHFIQEQRDLDEKRREQARIEEAKEKERQELMAQLSEEKRLKLASVTMDTPLDEMPDCQMKYDKIISEATNTGKVFQDAQFPPNEQSLGPNCLNRGVAKWVRARDKPNCVLYKDKINHLDVVQGALGDCYFLSAISVLGEKYVKKIILTTEEEWRTTGCFAVQFFKDGQPEMVIIDDFFPAYPNDQWIFVKGGNEGDELWPMVLEKAYAKMYGSYNYIEAGKVQYALADMTDGFPEQIDLRTEKNIQVLWEKLKTLKRHGALLGAGSPENSLGDRAINEMGIVQGHAYAVLDIQEVDGNKLMQLRNPHGSAGVEWKGDWSDTCLKWDQRTRNKVGYQKSEADGVFWMDIQDFVQQYSYLYICRILEESEGWVERRMRGKWEGASAEGVGGKARLDFNPQYEITVTKPCDGFISLMQFDRENMFRGKHFIIFMVCKQNGKRITTVDKNSLVCMSGKPVNLNIITSECDFDKSVRYPYKFTLMIANTDHGQKGEGEFEFAVYATDKNVTVKELPKARDFPSGGQIKDEAGE